MIINIKSQQFMKPLNNAKFEFSSPIRTFLCPLTSFFLCIYVLKIMWLLSTHFKTYSYFLCPYTITNHKLLLLVHLNKIDEVAFSKGMIYVK